MMNLMNDSVQHSEADNTDRTNIVNNDSPVKKYWKNWQIW